MTARTTSSTSDTGSAAAADSRGSRGLGADDVSIGNLDLLNAPTESRRSFSDWMAATSNPQMSFAPTGNLAMQSLLAPATKLKPQVDIRLDPVEPWKALVNAEAGWTEISLELYGVDLSPMFETDDGFMSLARAAGRVRLTLFTDLLRPKYADQFHSTMAEQLAQDVGYVEDKLLETWVDDDDEAAILGRVRWWSKAGNVRDRDGVSYFDRFLGKLDSDRYYTDYVATESSRSSFLSLVYKEIEDDVGELSGLVANHSERFGAFRPTTLFPAVSQQTDRSGALVGSVTDELLDRMVGFTSGSDERGIRGMITALPGSLQARVLEELMTRTSERRLKIFSRTGEQTGEGMLYFLFEDLDEDDRKKMGDDLVEKGVLKREAADALIERRTWAGRNLPWSTKHGKEAAEYWANEYNETDSKAYAGVSATLGSFASLWTPETAGTTIMVLATANPSGVVGSTIARAPLIVQKSLLVLGTGLGAYQATTSTMAAVSGEDSEGRSLSGAERVAKAIEAVSTVLMLGAGFHGATKLKPNMPPVGATETAALAGVRDAPLVAPQTAASSGEQRVAWRVMSETAEGEITAVGVNHATGDVAVIRINKHTGDGTVFSPRLGRANIVGGRPEPARLEIEAGAASAGARGGPLEVEVLSPGRTPAELPGPTPQKQLAGPPGMKQIPAATYEDISGELQAHIDQTFGSGDTPWRIAPDGTAFTVPPESLKPMPVYVPEGPLPPGEIFAQTQADKLAGLPKPAPQPVLAGPLQEGVSPFDVFPPPNAPTSRTLPQVRSTRGGQQLRGAAGRDHVAQQHGGAIEQEISLPERVTKTGAANPNAGLRDSDVLAPTLSGKQLNMEVKNYLRYISGGSGGPRFNMVSPNAQLRGEIWRDAMIPYYYPDQQPVWVFVGAPPSPALAAELAEAGIPWMVHSDAVPFRGGITP